VFTMTLMSPHLLRPYSPRQLSLVEGGDGVALFAVMGGRYAGPSVEVHAPTLARRVADLGQSIETVVFFDQPVPDGAMVSTIDDMLGHFEAVEADALVQFVPVTEAVKRVEREVVLEGMDRTSLVAVRCPEVIDRAVLTAAMSRIGDEQWVNPTALIASAGATIALYDGQLAVTR
jgi:2-C-methyl-D-erythritol 4-phosphate cytidylyltransferase